EALAPLGVVGLRGWREPAGDRTSMERIDVGDVEDHAAPTLRRAGRPRDEVQVARTNLEARKGGRLAAVTDREAERTVEAHGRRHVTRYERHRADALDHRRFSLPRICCAHRDWPTTRNRHAFHRRLAPLARLASSRDRTPRDRFALLGAVMQVG